ncbi:MAG: biopolymer transporter ExbD [Proteobacteria bacterium]|nr:MAG: biopolymer transporter ExbD [Pseudomonadota bacterium]
MLANQSILHETSLQSTLGAQSYIKPTHGKWRRNLAADLLLTALIDAFSILVIFLLMSFSSSGDMLFIAKGQELPKASTSEALERNPVVKVQDGKIFVEEKEVGVQALVATLLDLRKQFSETHAGQEPPGILMIQGDRRLKYEELNQVILAASHAGFSDIRFAVLVK